MQTLNQTEESPLTILLVDDDDSFRKVTRQVLEDRGLRVYDAANGKEAAAILGIANVQLVLSDVRMPVMHGIDLLHYIKTNAPKIPVMLMTGFADTIEIKEAYEIGANGFINKPFTIRDLESTLNEVLKPEEPISIENGRRRQQKLKKQRQMDDFCRLSIDDFSQGSAIKFPIYLRISDEKIIKVANRGEDLSQPMIQRFKAKGISHLLLNKRDCKEYMLLNTKISNDIAQTVGIDSGRKARLYSHSMKQILRLTSDFGFDSEVSVLVRKNIELIVDLFANDEEGFCVFEQLVDHAQDIYAHSIHVCMVSTMIAKAMGWSSSQKLFLVTAAGLFHDIGMQEVDRKLWFKRYSDMTRSERTAYETHPARGAAIVSRLTGFPEGMDQIVLQHHEYADGSGFPNHVGRVNTHPVAKIIGLADEFCHEWHDTVERSERVSPRKILRSLESRRHLFDGEFLLGLKAAINMDLKQKTNS